MVRKYAKTAHFPWRDKKTIVFFIKTSKLVKPDFKAFALP
jgi:hypothetical protein